VSRSAVLAARVFYAIVAILAFGIAIRNIIGAINAANAGCVLRFSQSDFQLDPFGAPLPGGVTCEVYVGILPIILGFLAGAVLVITALRMGHSDAPSRAVVWVGAIIGVVVAAAPMAMVWWLNMYYNQSAPDVVGIIIGVLPLLLGLAAAWVAIRAQGTSQVALP
jgi:hypothetical protein